MAGDATAVTGQSEGASSNGVSGSISADRAAFLARDAGVADEPAKAVAADIADDDSDLDEDDKAEVAAATDDDSDLDDDEDKADAEDDEDLDEEDEAEKNVDADTKKRLAAVRRTDQRLREQRDRQFKAEEARLATREAQLEQKFAEREAKAARLERIVERLKNPYELGDALVELGYSEDDFEPASQSTFARSKKFANDPKAKETVARLKSERDLREEVASLKKKDAEREAAAAEAQERAAAEQKIVTFMDTTMKSTTEKTPLAAALIEKNPQRAHAVIGEITGRLWDELGTMPTPKQVIVALEKSRRQDLRDLGVDPKSITSIAAAKKATAAPADKAAPAAKPSPTSKKAAVQADAKSDDKPMTKEDFINRKFD